MHLDQPQLFSVFVFPCGLAAGSPSVFLNNPELYNCHGTILTHTLVIYEDLHSGTLSYSLKTVTPTGDTASLNTHATSEIWST